MILGIGSDLIDIRAHRDDAGAVRRPLHRPRLHRGRSGASRDRRANRAASYAKRFAAKEACAKASAPGLRTGVFWRDMGVVNLPGGQPTMKLTGGAQARLEAMTPPGMIARIDLTMTDDPPLAQAIVIISVRPATRQ